MRSAHLLALAPCAAAALALVASPAAAEPPQGLYVTEAATGSVASILAGGDFAGVERFATGLSNPYGICVGPGNQLYVSEFDSGEVTVVDFGGNMANKVPFAFGLSGPSALFCTKTRIWVAEYDSSEVTEITAGGNAAMIPNAASGLPKVLGLLLDSTGVLWSAQPTGILDISSGGNYLAALKFADGQAGGMAQLLGQRLATDQAGNSVVEFSTGGDFSLLPVFASGLPAPAGITPTPAGLFVALPSTGEVFDITAGGSFAAAAPFASGLDNPLALAYWNGCGDGVVTAGEDCDTGPASATCDEDCTAPVCGDWVWNKPAGEQCDDGNTTDGDGCSATCQKEASGAGGAGGAGGTGGASNGGAGGTGGTSAGGSGGEGGAPRTSGSASSATTGTGPHTEPVPANGAGQSSSGAGGSAAEPDGEADDGCSCGVTGAPARDAHALLAGLVGLLALARRRRRI